MRSSEYMYYEVNGERTPNTLQAWEWANGDKNKIKFYWADDEHKKYDWTKEPTETIDELIDQRVRELRDKYNHLCLWYSGGYDSQTILDSFVRTGTRLDEILIFNREWIKPVNGINIEQEDPKNYALFVKKNFQPHLKITFVDMKGDTAYKFYKQHGTDWIYHDTGHYPWFSKTSRQTMDTLQDNFKSITEIIGRRDIEGAEKPSLNLINGKWYAVVNDKTYNWHMDVDRELFYISPEATKLYIKQIWLAIKWFEKHPLCSHDFVHKIQSQKYDDLTYQAWNLGFGRKMAQSRYEKVAYIKRHFGSGSDNMRNWWQDYAYKDNEDLFKVWRNGLQYIHQKYKDVWSYSTGFPVIMGEHIYIKDYVKNESLSD